MDQHARPDRTIPLQSVWSMVLSAMTVECKRLIIYSFTSNICTIICLFHSKKIHPNISKKDFNLNIIFTIINSQMNTYNTEYKV